MRMFCSRLGSRQLALNPADGKAGPLPRGGGVGEPAGRSLPGEGGEELLAGGLGDRRCGAVPPKGFARVRYDIRVGIEVIGRTGHPIDFPERAEGGRIVGRGHAQLGIGDPAGSGLAAAVARQRWCAASWPAALGPPYGTLAGVAIDPATDTIYVADLQTARDQTPSR